MLVVMAFSFHTSLGSITQTQLEAPTDLFRKCLTMWCILSLSTCSFSGPRMEDTSLLASDFIEAAEVTDNSDGETARGGPLKSVKKLEKECQ